MNFHKLKCFWLVAIAFTGIQGCASTQPGDQDAAEVKELAGDNLDLLYATEYPVASKQEALAKASQAYNDGDTNKAQFYLVRALKFDVSDTHVLAQIGNLHVLQGNDRLAARAFQFALQHDPEHAVSLAGLGLVYFTAGNDQEAKKYLEQAVAIAPKLWRAHNALGVIADRQKQYETAQSHYDIALEIVPSADNVLINRGFSKFLAEDYEAAALDFYVVCERSDNSRAWRNLGLVYAKQGWYESAIETFLEVGNESYAYNETGAIAMSNGDIDAAFHYLTEAVQRSPNYFAQAEKNLAELRKRNANRRNN